MIDTTNGKRRWHKLNLQGTVTGRWSSGPNTLTTNPPGFKVPRTNSMARLAYDNEDTYIRPFIQNIFDDFVGVKNKNPRDFPIKTYESPVKGGSYIVEVPDNLVERFQEQFIKYKMRSLDQLKIFSTLGT